ncbi:MAG: flagellar hook-length control protein FliK [Spirochaetaceae bacterium]|nr:MAG: flagellar hook-length control protein FliK [Spirochaetaceae bacterium]
MAANVSSAPASWDVGHGRGPDSTEIHRFAGFLERALIESEPLTDSRTGSPNNRRYDDETDRSRITRDDPNARTTHDDRKVREAEHAREAEENGRSEDSQKTQKNQKVDRSDETDTHGEGRASAAKREAEDATEAAAREKTSKSDTTDAERVASELGEQAGKATKITKKDSRDGGAVTGAEAKKSSSDDDEISRVGAAGAQKQLDLQEPRGSQPNVKHGDGEADNRHAAVDVDAGKKERTGDDETERTDAANGKKSDQAASARGAHALGSDHAARSDSGDPAEKREDQEDRGKKRGDEKSERVGSRDRDGEPRVKVIDTRRAERLDPAASGEASGSADENRTSSEAPGIEIRNQGGNEPVNARNPVRYAEASAELARSLRESANAEIVREARIILRTENSGEIRLVLRPEELGNVRIRLQMQDNHIAGRILVENSSIREIFAQNMDDLARAFAEAGIELGSMEVSVGDGERSDADDRPRSDGPQRVAGEFERNTHAVVYYGFEDTRVNVFA